MTRRIRIAAALAAVAIAVPAIAYATGEEDGAQRTKPTFPMSGDVFLEHVEQRLDNVEERIEARLAESDLDDSEKERIRKRYEQRASTVLEAAHQAAADGTVTQEEARAMRQAHGPKGKKGKKGKRGKRGKGAKGDRPQFPMAGDAFVSFVNNRISKRRARIEQRLADADDAERAEVLAKFDEGSAKLLAAAKSAAADGTVTKEEAKAIRAKIRKARKGHKARKGRKGRKGGPSGKRARGGTDELL